MDSKKFKMIDESFICTNCNKQVNLLLYTARDHCPYCLYSVHVDNNPGDRLSNCHGLLIPTGIEKYKLGYKILYKCNKCGEVKKNISALDDDMDKIIELSVIDK